MVAWEVRRSFRMGRKIATAQARTQKLRRYPTVKMVAIASFKQFMQIDDDTFVGRYRFSWNPNVPAMRNRSTGTLVDMAV